MKTSLLAVASLAALCLGESTLLLAQGPPAIPPNATPGDAIQVVVRSASGRERRPLSRDGSVDRVGLRPLQLVTLHLTFRGLQAGEIATAMPVDGGEIVGPASRPLSGVGSVPFVYRGGALPGRYRVVVRVAGQEYWLEFYGLDTNNPANNPPRVRIVD